MAAVVPDERAITEDSADVLPLVDFCRRLTEVLPLCPLDISETVPMMEALLIGTELDDVETDPSMEGLDLEREFNNVLLAVKFELSDASAVIS